MSKGSICYVVWYMCDCGLGCEGHRLVIEDEDGNEICDEFNFEHPDSHETVEEFALRLLKDNGFDSMPVDLEQCEVIY